jgi:hypothetical protein
MEDVIGDTLETFLTLKFDTRSSLDQSFIAFIESIYLVYKLQDDVSFRHLGYDDKNTSKKILFWEHVIITNYLRMLNLKTQKIN